MTHANSRSRRATAHLPILGWVALAAVPVPNLADDEAASEPVALGMLEVRVTGFESNEGRLAIALFANEVDYASQTNAIRKAWLDIVDFESVWQVPDLPEGEYALIAYHDENGNEQIDMRALGMPKEPVGVSNNARGIFGPPRFRAARFEFLAPLTRHALELR